MRLLLPGVVVLCLAVSSGHAQKHPIGLFVEGGVGMKAVYGGGVGYAFLRGQDLSIRVLTGPDEREGRKGDLNMGSIQWRAVVLPSGPISPFVEVGYGWSSLSGTVQYNGHGFQAAAGVRWWITTLFDVCLRGVFARIWYHQRNSPPDARPSFTDDRVWGFLSIGFTPGL
jgi:hypothetical protein